MKQSLAHMSLVVRDYDDAIDFFVNTLGFDLVADEYQPERDKRWVLVRPAGSTGCSIVLGKATNAHQEKYIGDQAGGRVMLFLQTDDFWRDYRAYQSKNVEFVREPKEEPYGTVAVFKDLYGNLWDLIQFADDRG